MEIYIDEQEKLNASVIANSYTDEDIKNRAYINTLGAELALKYLKSENIDISGIRNIHSIKKILEEFDIADIKLPNIKIDVRVIFDENAIFIPKSHFEYNLVPDIYLVFYLAKDFSHVKFLGFFEPQLINKNNANNKYYFIEKEKLTAPLNLKEFIENYKGSSNEIISETNLEKSENIIIAMADYDITEGEKKFLLENLNKNLLLRDKFIEYENFETLSTKAFLEPEVEIKRKKTTSEITPDSIKTLVDEISAEQIALENIQTEDILPEESISTDFEDIPTIEINDISIENTVTEDIPEIFTSENLEEISEETAKENFEETVEEVAEEVTEEVSKETTEETIEETVEETALESDEEDISEVISLESLSKNVIEPIAEDVVSSELETVTSLDDIQFENIEQNTENEDTEELLTLDNSIEEVISLPENVEDEDTSISLENIPTENEEILSLEEITLDDISETVDTDEETIGVDEIIDDVLNSEILTETFTDEEVSDEIEPTENSESFGKNLLENLALEEQDSLDKIPMIDDLLAQSDELQEEIIENIDENMQDSVDEIISVVEDLTENNLPPSESETEKENISLESVLDENILEETEISEQNSEEQHAEQTIEQDSDDTSGDDKLDVLFSEDAPADFEYTDEDVQIPGAAVIEKTATSNNKKYIIAAAAIAVIATVSAVTLIKPKANENIEPIEQPIEQPVEQPVDLPVEAPPVSIDKKVETNVPPVQIKTTQTPKELKNNIANKPIAESYLTINRIVWDVPSELSANPAIQNYLKTAGKSIKLSLGADLLLATEYAYTNQVKIGLKLSQSGSIQEAKIISGSGSSEIDNIVLQSVKDTLNVIKPPSSAVNTPDFNLNLIISF